MNLPPLLATIQTQTPDIAPTSGFAFAHAWALLFLVVPAILVAEMRVRRKRIDLPFDHRANRPRPVLESFLTALETLPAIVLALFILLVARPQGLVPRHERSLANIQLVMDVSGSMSGERYHNAAVAIEAFTRAREGTEPGKGDAMGLTIFGNAQLRLVPISHDLQAIRNALPFADPDHQTGRMGGTEIGAALRYVVKNMEEEAKDGDRLVVLISDGQSSDVENGNQYSVAKVLTDARCVLYYIHVAEDDPISEGAAELARLTGGEGLAAADSASLAAVFEHIDRMKPATFRQIGTVWMDMAGPFAALAAAALGLHTLALAGLRYTPW